MAARRLLILLVALLLISSLATALAPPQRESEENTTSTTTTDEAESNKDPADAPPPADVVFARLNATDPDAKEPILASVGDQLSLEVRASDTIPVQIPELGLYETAGRGAPALFDVVLRQEGTFAVLAGGERVGAIRVGDRGGGKQPSAPATPPKEQAEPEEQDPPNASAVRA